MVEKNVFRVFLTVATSHPLLRITTLTGTLVVPSQSPVHHSTSMRPDQDWVISHSITANLNVVNHY
jgi:hypothetical protein